MALPVPPHSDAASLFSVPTGRARPSMQASEVTGWRAGLRIARPRRSTRKPGAFTTTLACSHQSVSVKRDLRDLSTWHEARSVTPGRASASRRAALARVFIASVSAPAAQAQAVRLAGDP